MKIKYPFIDLFAGCGGLSLGLELSGFTPVYVNELNNDLLFFAGSDIFDGKIIIASLSTV